MSELITERIAENLGRLRLTRTQELLSGIAKDAQDNGESHLAFLDRLLQEEVSAKEERRLRTSL
jgi:DNA replication protein DnaC